MAKQNCFDWQVSRLSQLFVKRCGNSSDSPDVVMRQLARRLSSEGCDRGDVDYLVPLRRIDTTVMILDDLPCDGLLEPKGSTYADGFTMRLRSGQARSRLRFTKAHEICHTFFYELVPEWKFQAHSVDQAEERLCNIGAEELLMPYDCVRAEANAMPVSIESLTKLADRFEVSLAAMLLRLRGMGLWQCELACWHRMFDGSFVLDRKTGGRQANWEIDSSILYRVWDSDGLKAQSGMTFMYFKRNGVSAAERVYYQAKRRGDMILTLLSHRKLVRAEKVPPLLRSALRNTVTARSGSLT